MAEQCRSDVIALPARKFQFVGGDLCLDFCNTMGGKRGAVEREILTSYLDFLSWSSQAGLVPSAEVQALASKAVREPEEANAVLERAHRLREAIYRIFVKVMAGTGAAQADLDELNQELSVNLCRLRVARPDGCHYAWQWAGDGGALDQALGPVARAAAELLTQNECCARVRQCKGDNCGWLFLDASKNHSRCWCDMRDCGNRAKVRRHRLRAKREEKGS